MSSIRAEYELRCGVSIVKLSPCFLRLAGTRRRGRTESEVLLSRRSRMVARLVRLMSDVSGVHQACRRSRLSSRTAKKLRAFEIAYHVTRHASTPYIAMLVD